MGRSILDEVRQAMRGPLKDAADRLDLAAAEDPAMGPIALPASGKINAFEFMERSIVADAAVSPAVEGIRRKSIMADRSQIGAGGRLERLLACCPDPECRACVKKRESRCASGLAEAAPIVHRG